MWRAPVPGQYQVVRLVFGQPEAVVVCGDTGDNFAATFDDLIRQIGRIPKSRLVPNSLVLNDEGHLDRRCPAPECGAAFKVLSTDWREKVPDEQAWCAICGEQVSSTTPSSGRQSPRPGAERLRLPGR